MYRYVLAACVCVLALTFPSLAIAENLEDFSVFGNDGVLLKDDVQVEDGLVGSNDDVTYQRNTNTQGAKGGGDFDSGANNDVKGDLTFNGNVHIGGGTEVEGDVNSGNNVTSGTSIDVDGDITAAGTITLGSGANVGGTQTAPGSPVTYTPTALPAQTAFSTGGLDINKGNGETTTLAPGSYGALVLGNNNELNLVSGNYYFDSILLGDDTDMNINLSTGVGHIGLFIAGDLIFLDNVDIKLVSGDASAIFSEIHGKMEGGEAGEWNGTFFVPNGLIALQDNNDVTGALYSGKTITLGDGTEVNFMLADAFGAVEPIPEPASMLLLGFGLGMMGMGVRKKQT